MAAPIVYTDYDSEAENIARRQKYAEALRDQASAALPTGQMVGNRVVPISWTQGLAQALKGYVGHKMSEKASEDRRALAAKRNAALAEVLGSMPKAQNVALPTDQEGTGSFDMSGMAGPQQKLQAPTMQDNAAWLGRAAGLGGNAPQLATTMLGMQQKADENEANRQSRTMDRIMALESAAANLAASREERAQRAREANDLRRELATEADKRAREMQTSQQTFLAQQARQAAADRAALLAQKGAAGGKQKLMSPVAQKELIQTEEEIEGSKSAIKSLGQALDINDKAMGFTGAGAVASVGTLLPESIRPKAVDATQDFDNILQGSALPQLKAIFGGMPTEGERKILLDIQGSSSKPPAVRKKILKRAIEAANRRIQFGQEKAKKLRSGEFFADEGTSSADHGVIDFNSLK